MRLWSDVLSPFDGLPASVVARRLNVSAYSVRLARRGLVKSFRGRPGRLAGLTLDDLKKFRCSKEAAFHLGVSHETLQRFCRKINFRFLTYRKEELVDVIRNYGPATLEDLAQKTARSEKYIAKICNDFAICVAPANKIKKRFEYYRAQMEKSRNHMTVADFAARHGLSQFTVYRYQKRFNIQMMQYSDRDKSGRYLKKSEMMRLGKGNEK